MMSMVEPVPSHRILSVLAHEPAPVHGKSYNSQSYLTCHYSDGKSSYGRTRYCEYLIGSHPREICGVSSRYPHRHQLVVEISHHLTSLHRKTMKKYLRDLQHQILPEILIQIHQNLIVHDYPSFHDDRSGLFFQHLRVQSRLR